MQAIDPHVHDKSSPRGLIGRIYVGNHLLFIKPHGFRDIFYVFPHYMSMGVIDQQGVASLDSRDMIGRIYVVKY